MPTRLIPLKWRPPRLRLRSLMIVVAVVALPLATWTRIEARREQFRRTAAFHRDEIVGGISIRGNGRLSIFPVAAKVEYQILSQTQVDLDMWHLELSEKYEQAAERPWLPVAPDPDPPGR